MFRDSVLGAIPALSGTLAYNETITIDMTHFGRPYGGFFVISEGTLNGASALVYVSLDSVNSEAIIDKQNMFSSGVFELINMQGYAVTIKNKIDRNMAYTISIL